MGWLTPREGPALMERLDEFLPNRNLIKRREGGTPASTTPLREYGQTLATPEELAKMMQQSPVDIEEFLRQHMGDSSRGGRGGGGVSLAELTQTTGEDRDRAEALIDTIRAVKTVAGALEAQRPLTETFDTLTADRRMRAANPERRPDNTDYWRGQNMPKWVGGEAGVAAHGDPRAAARLMFDVDKRAETSYENAINKLLGMEKEEVANRNLTKKEEFDRMVAPLLAQMPDKMEVDLSKDLSKTGLAQAKLSLAMQQQAQRAQRESANEEKLRMAAELLRTGAIKPADFLALKKQMAGFGSQKDWKFDEKEVETYRMALDEKMGNAPDAAKQRVREAFVRVLSAGGTPGQAYNAATNAMTVK